MPQGSVLVSILFNKFLCNKFFMTDTIDIESYADDNDPLIV